MLNVSPGVRRDVDQDENGESFIPASQRPDGTWRKARRIKEGYVPQEEVPLYESKGKKFLSKQSVPAEPVKIEGFTGHKSIPGLFIEEKEKVKSKKKTKKVEEITSDIGRIKISEPTKPAKTKQPLNSQSSKEQVDPAKKLKNLKKRLREVEALELKLKSGEIAKPEPEQLTKIQRKNDLIMQINELEKKI